MAEKNVVEIPEVHVTGGALVPTEEFDRRRSTVCLLKSSSTDPRNVWTASGFFVNVKFKNKRNEVKDFYCIMTNYHVFQMKQEQSDEMIAVFHHDNTEKEPIEIPLVPFKLIAKSSDQDLDYVMISVDEGLMRSVGVRPSLADATKLPNIREDNEVYIFQHPRGKAQHYSHGRVKRVNNPFIEYYADTLKGSSGSPVFVLNGSTFSLIALHSKGVESYPTNWNKGVLISAILYHLQTGKVPKPVLPSPGVPNQMESGISVVGNKDPSKQVTKEDIRYIATDIADVWEKLGRALGHSDGTLVQIDKNYNDVYEKCYQMLLKWTQIKVKRANYGALSAGFADVTVKRPDLITKYC